MGRYAAKGVLYCSIGFQMVKSSGAACLAKRLKNGLIDINFII
jgi:hypothetical protein